MNTYGVPNLLYLCMKNLCRGQIMGVKYGVFNEPVMTLPLELKRNLRNFHMCYLLFVFHQIISLYSE